ncbi:AEC family transporter [Methylophilus sp. QUAN]|uniref:AEC family transporter n=1 Tax=Methylophilus sp. QUAN TaxID=2781020 RepID=UPI00188E6C81|nr:AEC family transporter [Methylophilus sp. QUAN]MBF4992228.1 AEC family transporter [Methylophilus sp. QUAN]
MLAVMLQMALMIAAGMLWQRLAPDHMSALAHRRALTDLVFYILLPALVLDILWQAPFDASTLSIALTALSRLTVAALCMWLTLQLLQRVMTVSRAQQGALMLAATFPNATYLGLPVTSEVLGDWTHEIVLKFDLFACTPVLLTLGMLMAQTYDQSEHKSHPVRELMRVPPLWALLLATVLNVGHIPQPVMISHALHTLAGGVVPLMLIALGMSIRWDTFKLKLIPLLLPVCVIGLLIAPLAAQHVAIALGLHGDQLTACILLAAMPTMVFGIVICERYRLDGALYAAAVFMSTLLSIGSLSLWFVILQP